MREVEMTHVITGNEPFLHHTLKSVGIPPLHIIRANNSDEYRFYELTGDLDETLHFSHFENTSGVVQIRDRIKIGDPIQIKSPNKKSAASTIKIKT